MLYSNLSLRSYASARRSSQVGSLIDNYRGVLPLEDLGLVYKSVKLVLGATEEEQEVSNESYNIIIFHPF